MTPRISLRHGIMGLLYPYSSSIVNTQYSSQREQNLALYSVILLFTSLLPFQRSNQPPDALLQISLSIFISYYPYVNSLSAEFKIFFLSYYISDVFLAFGRFLKQLIMSRGRANNPTPPNMTTKNHPKNDIIAMIYTAKETQIYKVVSFQLVLKVQLLKFPPLLSVLLPADIQRTGSDANLKKFQLTKSRIMDTIFAMAVYIIALTSLLQNDSSSSVSQKNKEKGNSKQTKMIIIPQRKYQKLFMSIPFLSIAEQLATSSGTMRACAWHRVSPTMTSIFGKTAVPKPLSSVCTQRARIQILMAINMKVNMMAKAISKPLFIFL